MRRRHARLGSLVATALLPLSLLTVPASASAAALPPLPDDLTLSDSVAQLVTVTSAHWSDTRASLRVWRKRADGWHLVHGPLRVRLGWNGWVPAADRLQDTGTTPAGRFGLRYVFGNRADPGTAMRYRRVDGNDVWPYEPRDAATYNIYQPRQAATSRWRTDFREQLASYPYQYAYAVVIGFNMPHGVHWSTTRHQFVARRPADTARGGGIFLHVARTRYTAGCVAGPLDDIRWIVRWLDPALSPRIVMGPGGWVRRTF